MLGRLALIPLLFLVASCSAAAQQPCTDATAACTEFVAVSAQWQALAHRTQPLTARNDAATRALAVVHGAERDAAVAFATALAAAAGAERATSQRHRLFRDPHVY